MWVGTCSFLVFPNFKLAHAKSSLPAKVNTTIDWLSYCDSECMHEQHNASSSVVAHINGCRYDIVAGMCSTCVMRHHARTSSRSIIDGT